ncbi:enhancer of mRNA-decapping protein 4 homolog isoform X2 [Contarinia nasturtii]|uniref:enhancer of mRNA-decapping protein 4 homolog isoform X2 n=1 Tax=Contarinia nasturtii TaxID=265458 RepID=UPI0012D44536|nr:enhancer of mRNA-decapping protein 4 homolog isoform X2 [Contarinia nasturtii]
MPLLFLISELVHSKYFDSAANSFLLRLFNFYKYICKQMMDTPKIVAAKDNITFKKVTFDGGEQSAYETDGASVVVVGSSGSHDHGSSKIKLKNIVDYKWEVKNYIGRLIAVHLDGKYVAYAIKVAGKKGNIEGMVRVRVANPNTGSRALIRGKSSEVLDLQFAHMKSQIMLASIENTALHIHKIETINDNIICTLQLKIDDPVEGHVSKFDKINWCPYVPENETETDNDAGKLLVWTRGTSFQCYNVGTVVDNYGIGTHHANDITEGSLKFYEVSAITDASLSPDGTTLAITLEDGDIRFYQVYFHCNEDEPRLLHQWTPHEKKPVSGLFFLDDHTKSAAGSLWKYAITASDNNTEFKVWCCSSWECLQTIRFEASDGKPMFFKTEIDPTSSYLVLTDAKSRNLYVMQILQEEDAKSDVAEVGQNGSQNGTKPYAFIKSITEFPVSSPILSFNIVDATVRKYKCAYNDVYLLEDLDDYDEDNLNRYCVVIHLFLVQPKSVQECHVLYQPSLSVDADVGSSISVLSDSGNNDREEEALVNDLASMLSITKSSSQDDSSGSSISSVSKSNVQIRALLDSASSASGTENSSNVTKTTELSKGEINKPSSALNLLTPDSFHSSGKITPEGVSNEVYSTLRMLAGEKPVESSKKPLLLVNNKQGSDESDKVQLMQQVSEESNNGNNEKLSEIVPPLPPASMLNTGVSGGSSPSREVQEILSQKGSDCINDFYSNSIDIQDDTDASGNNCDAADGNDEEKNSNQDDDETYTLNNVTESANQASAITAPSKIDWPDAPTTMQTFSHNPVATETINDINIKLDQLMEIIQTQNCQLSELRSEVADLKKSQSNAVATSKQTQNVDINIQKLEHRVSRLVEEYLSRNEREQNKRLENFLMTRDNQVRENIVMGLGPVLCNQLSSQLAQVFVTEIQKHLLPVVGARLDGIKAQIQSEIAQKLTITDKVIKENISNICKSKETSDIFGHAVVNGIKSGLQQIYIESMRSVILPAYEKANAELFKQLYDTFNKGTIAYANQMANYTKMYEPIHAELINIMQTVPEQLRSLNEASVNVCTQRVSNEINKDIKTMQVNLLKTLKENIKMEIKKGFETQAANLEDSVMMAVRSQAQTPAPSVFDVQEQIKALLHQGQVNKAFHQALQANDLHLVEYVLERADINQVFNPCSLEQTVLLSLIQQISADMLNHSELKQKYLSDAIINLNMRDQITKEHSPKVLKDLLSNCQIYLSANPHSPLSSNVRVLIMAVQGFGITSM